MNLQRVLRRRKRTTAVGALVSVLIASTAGSCAGGSPDFVLPTEQPQLGAEAVFADFTIPKDRLREARDGASDYQLAALEDGKLTFAEYEAAVLAMVSCVKSSSIQVEFALIGKNDELEITSGPVLNKRGKYRYGFLYHGSVSDSEEVISGCKTTYLERLEFFWAEHVAPTVEEIQQARRAIGRCMRESGEVVPEDPSPSDFLPFLERNSNVHHRCSKEASEDFALPGFNGT